MRCLSVDTQVDYWLERFHQSRRRSVNGSKPDNLDFMPRSLVSQSGLLMTLLEAERRDIVYHSICISAHGDNGIVFDDSPPGHLLSTFDLDEIFRKVTKDRWIYILACDVAADEMFVEKVLSNGGKGLVAFNTKPSWQSDEELKMWQAIDSIFLRVAARKPSYKTFRKATANIVRHYESIYPDSTRSEKIRINRVLRAIKNMIIEGQTDA